VKLVVHVKEVSRDCAIEIYTGSERALGFRGGQEP
jgi:hypothetical protein